MKKIVTNILFLGSLIMAFQVEARVGQDKKSWAPITGQNKDSYPPEFGKDKNSRPPKKKAKKLTKKKAKKEQVEKVNEDISQKGLFDLN